MSDAETASGGRSGGTRFWDAGVWDAVAVVGFAALTVAGYAGAWRPGFDVAVPSRIVHADDLPVAERRRNTVRAADHLLVVGIVGRNAYTLSNHPTRLFHHEACHPQPYALALGAPMIALGVMAIPGWLATGDPVAAYNFGVAFSTWIAALAMYVLVRRWTGVPAAALAAGILYGFGRAKLFDVVHPYVGDTSWTLLALLFARELFAHGRWRDAAALGVCAAMQIATSFYPFLVAVFLGLTMLVWLVVAYGVRALRPGPVALTLVLVALGAWGVFGPFLELRGEAGAELARQQPPIYGRWGLLVPGGRYFSGWLALVLAVAALAPGGGRSLAGIRGDPRLALAIGAVFLALLAAGGNAHGQVWGYVPFPLPNVYEALGRVLPGLDQVRAPVSLFHGVHLVVCLLAGIGAASWLLRLPVRARRLAGPALALAAWLVTLPPPGLGLTPAIRFVPYVARPEAETLAFFERLEALGNDGPVVEVPWADFLGLSRAAIAAAYHHRPTSACRNSMRPPVSERVERLSRRLPQERAAERLRDLGFTTVVVHHAGGVEATSRRIRSLLRAGDAGEDGLRRVHGDEKLSAYALE